MDRGLAYGDGLFETISVIRREMPLWRYHSERLLAGCKELKIPWNHADSVNLKEECLELLERNGRVHGIIKIIVTRGEGGRGYSPRSTSGPNRVVSCFDSAAASPGHQDDGVAVKICSTSLGHNRRLAGIKHLNRLEQVLATEEWHGSDYDEGLMRDCRGDVIEGTRSNLFLVRGGQLLTPSLEDCGVKGVMRRYILDQSAHMGIESSVRRVSLDCLEQSDEVFVCNGVHGIWPVVKLHGEPLSHPIGWQKGRLTERLQIMIQSNLGLPGL